MLFPRRHVFSLAAPGDDSAPEYTLAEIRCAVGVASDGGAKPQLSDVETKVDASQKAHLKTKLTTRVLNSIKACPVQFLETTASPVPKQARLLTKSSPHSEKFIEASRELANYLFEQHTGATSPSLLCVVDAAASGAG